MYFSTTEINLRTNILKEREVILRNFVFFNMIFCLHAKISKRKSMQIVASTNGTSYDTGSDAFENKEQ